MKTSPDPGDLSGGLGARIHAVSVEFMMHWLEGVRARPGNPARMELIPVGGSVAALATGAADVPFMNTVYGLRPDDFGVVDQALNLYADRGLEPAFELLPAQGIAGVTALLADHGLIARDVYVALCGGMGSVAGVEPSDVAVRPVVENDDELFARVMGGGHGLTGAALEQAVENMLPWRDIPGLSRYIASSDGVVAGAAALMLSDGLGYLANASVLPGHRRRGVHSALVRQRIATARGTGSEFVCGIASSGSFSQRTMEHAGLRPVYRMERWARPLDRS